MKTSFLRKWLTHPYWLFVSIFFSFPVLAEQVNQADHNRYTPYSIAISGGVSLGSYEAGLNWALMRYLNYARRENALNNRLPPALKSLSGASAGSINALISAVSWCIDEKKASQYKVYHNQIENNVFRDTWLNVGIDDLLPEEQAVGKTFRKDDALLSRNALQPAIDKIKTLLSLPIFRDDCHLPLGITLTSVKPVVLNVSGVSVKNQRFIVPIVMKVDASGSSSGLVSFYNFVGHETDPLLGNVLHLQYQDKDSNKIPVESVIETVVASSAFPLVFGRKRLPICVIDEEENNASEKSVCPQGYRPASAEFIDGGLFDNIPLGTAKALAEPEEFDSNTREIWVQSARRYNYIYLTADNRRPIGKQKNRFMFEVDSTGKPPLSFGLRSQLEFVTGAVFTSRNYELYTVLRQGKWTGLTYQSAIQLIDIYQRLNPEVSALQIQSPNAKLDMNLCNAVLLEGLDTKPQQTEAAKCIFQAAQKLEHIYYGEYPELSSDEIVLLRQSLLNWMVSLAKVLNEPQLAWTIESLKTDKLGDRLILVSSRFAPITGLLFSKFGAFFDRPFREYDYYAGIYDASNDLATFLCHNLQFRITNCLAQKLKEVYELLDIQSSRQAKSLFLEFLQLEHGNKLESEQGWDWVMAIRPDQQRNNMSVILESLRASENIVNNMERLTVFMENLNIHNYDTRSSSQFMKRTLQLSSEDKDTWYYPLARRISTRLLTLEENEKQTIEGGELMLAAVALSAFAVHSFAEEDYETLSISRSTAPTGSWQRWLPYEMGADLFNGGAIISWEPSYRFNRELNSYLDIKLSPAIRNTAGSDRITFSQIDMFYSYKAKGLLSSFGFGPTYTNTWKQWPNSRKHNFGAAIYLGFLQDKFRLSIGARSFDENNFAGDNIYLFFGITDIPGIAYWTSKAF